MTESRNSNHRTPGKDRSTGRVGGRHRDSLLPQGRGGYLDICNETEITIQDLKNILRHQVLADVAEEIGADAFIAMWKMVDELQDNCIWLRLPSFSRLERFKRNEMILAMAGEGVMPSIIRERLKSVGIKLSLRAIHKIILIDQLKD